MPCYIGEDIAQQVLTSQQWVEGVSIAPNLISFPDSTDLSVNEFAWLLRPLGGSWILLPGLILGLSLGNSIHLSLFALSILMGSGWLKLAGILSINNSSIQLLSFLLALIASLGSLSLSTASIITSAFFPWLLIWSLYLCEKWTHPKQNLKIHLISIIFFFAIGAIACFKLSSLLTVSSILIIPFVFQFLKFRKINYQICVRGIGAIVLFFLPYFLLSSLNQNLTGVSSDELYAQQNFNTQHELWGEYFTESTRGGMLVTSLIASVGYASPAQSLVHTFRDLLLQFENFLSSLHYYEINPRILGCCILSIPFTLIIFSSLWKIRQSLSQKELILYFSLFVIPFLGFAILSYHHGYNYLIYHSYTKDFVIIFLIFAICYNINTKRIVKK